MIRRRLAPLLALLVLGGVIYLAAADVRPLSGDDRPAAESAESDLRRVRVAAVEPAAAERTLRFSGVVRARNRARLGFVNGGRLTTRPVELGEHVVRGRVLARIDDRELANAVASARAALDEISIRRAQAEREHERVVQLAAARAATAEEEERAELAAGALAASEDAAKARLAEAERRLAETVLRAPFAGTVTEILAEPGEFAASGRPILTLSGDGALEVALEVPERVLAGLAAGDAVTVELPAADEPPIAGRVVSIARAAAPGQLFPVVVDLGAPVAARAGMSAEVALASHDPGALAVPVEAVIDPGGRRPAVFRVDGADGGGAATVARVPVEVGAFLGNRVVVRGALAAGDRVVVGGQRGLLDGDRVLADDPGESVLTGESMNPEPGRPER